MVRYVCKSRVVLLGYKGKLTSKRNKMGELLWPADKELKSFQSRQCYMVVFILCFIAAGLEFLVGIKDMSIFPWFYP